MNYRERMKEYLKEPDVYSSQYGKWGILNKEQRDLIKRLLEEMDNADNVIKHQFFEIERLNKELAFERQIKKEVREYIELWHYRNDFRVNSFTTGVKEELLEILDKANEKENK